MYRNSVSLWLSVATIAMALILTGANYRTDNFIVSAGTDEAAREVGAAAEKLRRDLAVDWLGAELPPWSQPCPIRVAQDASGAATGRTAFSFRQGKAADWEMTVMGELPAVIESVLPHEVMHTVLATHFGRPLPRWADEGICTNVEHPAEIRRHNERVAHLLRRQQSLSLPKLFVVEHYPRDPIPFYMQSFSVSCYLIERGGRQQFINFLDAGSRSGDWAGAVRTHYGVRDLAELESLWRQVADQSTALR